MTIFFADKHVLHIYSSLSPKYPFGYVQIQNENTSQAAFVIFHHGQKTGIRKSFGSFSLGLSILNSRCKLLYSLVATNINRSQVIIEIVNASSISSSEPLSLLFDTAVTVSDHGGLNLWLFLFYRFCSSKLKHHSATISVGTSLLILFKWAACLYHKLYNWVAFCGERHDLICYGHNKPII